MAHNSKYESDDIDLDVEEVYERDGERLTEARAEEIAEETLAKIGRGGRPSLSGGNVHSPTIQARVSTDLHEQLRQLARQQGVTQSDLVREAVEAYVAEMLAPRRKLPLTREEFRRVAHLTPPQLASLSAVMVMGATSEGALANKLSINPEIARRNLANLEKLGLLRPVAEEAERGSFRHFEPTETGESTLSEEASTAQ